MRDTADLAVSTVTTASAAVLTSPSESEIIALAALITATAALVRAINALITKIRATSDERKEEDK
jgi:hypothetical protein